MDPKITRREVFNNLIRFKDTLLELHEKDLKEKKNSPKRVYKLLLNKENGEMRFAKKISDLGPHVLGAKKEQGHLKNWVEVLLVVESDENSSNVRFRMEETPGKSIDLKKLEKQVQTILSEMLEVLNLKGQEVASSPREALPEEIVLENLSSIHLVSEDLKIENQPGWKGEISREDAENVLKGQLEGTYLLRKADSMILGVSFHLSEENHTNLDSYVISYVNEEEKISEKLILHTSKGWTFFLDDPDLDQSLYRYYPTAQELIKTMQEQAHTPMF